MAGRPAAAYEWAGPSSHAADQEEEEALSLSCRWLPLASDVDIAVACGEAAVVVAAAPSDQEDRKEDQSHPSDRSEENLNVGAAMPWEAVRANGGDEDGADVVAFVDPS